MQQGRRSILADDYVHVRVQHTQCNMGITTATPPRPVANRHTPRRGIGGDTSATLAAEQEADPWLCLMKNFFGAWTKYSGRACSI